jgi:hypothetical protein
MLGDLKEDGHGTSPNHLNVYAKDVEEGEICSRYGANFSSFLTMEQSAGERQIYPLVT